MGLLKMIGAVMWEFLALTAGVFFLAALTGLVILLVGLTSGVALVAGLMLVGATLLAGIFFCISLLQDWRTW